MEHHLQYLHKLLLLLLLQILHDITGQVLPGEVLALMGPSGSGKTSLLSVVSGRAPRMMKTEGEVTINNKPLTKTTKRRMGFVTQVRPLASMLVRTRRHVMASFITPCTCCISTSQHLSDLGVTHAHAVGSCLHAQYMFCKAPSS